MTTYKESGVDVENANLIVDCIKDIAKPTYTPNILSGVGGFAAAFRIPPEFKKPVIVTCTDGVGTKVKLSYKWGHYENIGIDLVAMSVNDLITLGAKPLTFLDYYATNTLHSGVTEMVVKGIAEGCKQSDCALVGGEIAEMPGMYAHDGFELAGFCVGVVEVDKIITGTEIEAGNVFIGLRSSGPHSNGYSLINKIIDEEDYRPSELQWLKDSLLAPTRIYYNQINHLLSSFPSGTIKGMAHITGGGLVENISRMSKIKFTPNIKTKEILNNMPSIFNWIQEKGNISYEEMLKTFNCGVGFVICVKSEHANTIKGYLNSWGEDAKIIGEVTNC